MGVGGIEEGEEWVPEHMVNPLCDSRRPELLLASMKKKCGIGKPTVTQPALISSTQVPSLAPSTQFSLWSYKAFPATVHIGSDREQAPFWLSLAVSHGLVKCLIPWLRPQSAA